MNKRREIKCATKSELQYIHAMEERSSLTLLEAGEAETLSPSEYPEPLRRFLTRERTRRICATKPRSHEGQSEPRPSGSGESAAAAPGCRRTNSPNAGSNNASAIRKVEDRAWRRRLGAELERRRGIVRLAVKY